ncbi:MAG TPA: hypothetical protein VLA29_13420 [Acidimicrobiia bacterium]|nr:hypothetical protein [Acidimicrobiia bacterium]
MADDDTPEGRGEPAPVAYRSIDTRARRRSGYTYLASAVVAGVITVVSGVGAMWLTAVIPLIALGAYQVAGAWRMRIGDMDAIRIASEAASFPVGHGSATLGYRGLLAKPVWQVLVFSASPSPDHQALVTVDAMTGAVTGSYEEAVDLP